MPALRQGRYIFAAPGLQPVRHLFDDGYYTAPVLNVLLRKIKIGLEISRIIKTQKQQQQYIICQLSRASLRGTLRGNRIK